MPDPTMESELARARAVVFEPHTLFRVPPMSGLFVNVTEAGYRQGAEPQRWPPKSDAVFVFGGSTAFGYGVADAETIPAHLQTELGAQVYNWASPNFASVQERIRFEQLLLDGHRPRAAIFIDGFSDFIAPYYQPVMLEPLARATQPRSILRRIFEPKRGVTCRVPDPAVVVDRYLRNRQLLRAVCRELGVRLLTVWQPVPCFRYAGPAQGHGDSAPLIECVVRGYELMETRRPDPEDFLWLADIQRGRSDSLYVDADHYTAAFSREIAEHIGRHLFETGFVA